MKTKNNKKSLKNKILFLVLKIHSLTNSGCKSIYILEITIIRLDLACVSIILLVEFQFPIYLIILI